MYVTGAGSQSTISKLEAGSRSPRADELDALAMILAIPADQLLGIPPRKPTNPTEIAREVVRRLETIEENKGLFYFI